MLLSSLHSQTKAPPTEILLVDNRSTDNLRKFIKQWEPAERSAHIVNLEYVAATEHQGVSYARNVGVANASAEQILFMYSDDAASAEWLSDGAEIFSATNVFSGSAMPVASTHFDTTLNSVRSFIGPPAPALPLKYEQNSTPFPVLMGGDMGIKAELFRDLGGFDQSLPSAGEDNELALRLRSVGIPIGTSNGLRIAYRQRLTLRSQTRLARTAARAHVLNAERYSLVASSPMVGSGRLVRTTLRPVLTLMRPSDGSNQSRIRTASIEIGRTAGIWEGILRYRLFGAPPARLLGVGLQAANDVQTPG